MNLDGIRLIRLSDDYAFKPFDCDDTDLNDFFINDCLNYQKELLAVTYILETDQKTVAFFSIFNDKISLKDVGNPNLWERLFKNAMPEGKRLSSYPAMKIGRLGVHIDYKKTGIGTTILNYLKALFINNNRTGCKYITVDAYSQSLVFYEKNGFLFLTEKDKNKDTRAMYFDLQKIISVEDDTPNSSPNDNSHREEENNQV